MLIISFSILLDDKVAPADCICMEVRRWNIGALFCFDINCCCNAYCTAAAWASVNTRE